MNKKMLSSVLIGTMSLSVLAGCSKPAESSTAASLPAAVETVSKPDLTIAKEMRDVSSDEEDKFRQGYLDFSFEMLRQNLQQDGADANVMVSPASIMLTLDMTAAGARGDTLAQMMNLYGGLDDPQGQLSYAAKLLKKINGANGVKLHAADSIWVNKDVMPEGLLQDYKDFVNDNFDAQIEQLTFNDDARATINGWVSDKTDKMIPSLLDELRSSDAMLLINAIVFDGKWAKQYMKSQVQDGAFRSASGEVQEARMMSSEEDHYLENDKATGFVKYYQGRQYAFVVMLPKDKDQNAGDLVSGFTGESFDEYLASDSEDYVVRTKLPEFSYDWGRSIAGQLKAMGMEVPFDDGKAQFSGINGADGLAISDVIHKTHIEVNMNGTRAAAATVVEMTKGLEIADSREVKEVICDRPFAYAIVDMTDNTPVFIGTVNNI